MVSFSYKAILTSTTTKQNDFHGFKDGEFQRMVVYILDRSPSNEIWNDGGVSV